MTGEAGGKSAASPVSLNDAFAQALPYYLKMGMSYEAFWYGPTDAHRAYREADRLRLREQNQMLWLQGRYVYDAMICVTPYLKAFSKSRPRSYLKEPYDIDMKDKERREEREAKERYERIKANVAAFAKAFNEKPHESEDKGVDDNAGCVP